MKRITTVALTALFAVTTLTEAEAQRRRSDRSELAHYTYKSESFDAKSLSGKGSYGIFLPKGYDDEKNAKRTYPLAVWLHGMRGDANRFYRSGARAFDALTKAKKLPPMILVTPSATRRPTYIDRGRGRNEESFITKDLLSHLEKTYRVSKERRHRAIMGVSMGALGAMKIAVKHPKMFGTVAVHSSPILTEDPADLGRYKRFASSIFGDPIDKEEWAKEIPVAILAKKSPKDLHGLRIYFDAGSRDRYGFGPTNTAFSKKLKQRKFEHTFRYIQGGGHSWGSNAIQTAMVHSFGFVAKGFTAKPKPKPTKQKSDRDK